MRVVFVNLHANEFLVKTAYKFIFKHSVALKHKYILDYLLHCEEVEICTFINKYGFSMARNLKPWLMKILIKTRFAEHRFVMRKNGIPLKSIKVLKDVSEITCDDIVISYLHTDSSLKEISGLIAFKAVSTIHIHGTRDSSDLIKASKPNVLFCEADLHKYSTIFNRFYNWYKDPFIVHSFVAAPRYKKVKPFAERECRAFSTGTITYKTFPDFLSVYGDPCDQPTRKQILDNSAVLKPYVECYNFNYVEDVIGKEYKDTDNYLVHLYKVLYNTSHLAQQKKYFSFNMVEKFNNFKMCIVGEEILGIPGIGFVEGMACGCAYIGQTIGYYEDYGMQEGVHYIGYDGTLEDLKAKISYYQQPEHQDELERIANAGYEFAQTHFRGDTVAKDLLDKLIQAQTEWKSKAISNS